MQEVVHNYDETIRLVIMGEDKCLKTHLLTRLSHAPCIANKFCSNYMTQYGKDFRVRKLMVNEMRLKVYLWKEELKFENAAYPFNPHYSNICDIWSEIDGIMYVVDMGMINDKKEITDIALVAQDTLWQVKQQLPGLPQVLVQNSANKPTENDACLELFTVAKQLGVEWSQISIREGFGTESLLSSLARNGVLYKWKRETAMPQQHSYYAVEENHYHPPRQQCSIS